MSNIVPSTANLPAELQDVFNAEELAGDLYDGTSGGFAVIGFKGSRWKIKSGGEEEPVLDDNGEAKPSLEVVLVKASREISKVYYDKDYAEGDDSAPDCSSVDSTVPDAESANPQSETCATCPNNAWGSKITPAGKKSKACGDSRRVAVVPLQDIANEPYGGAMLLRVPAASLSDLAKYGKGMQAKGFPYNAIGTRLGFDINAAYPKLTFKPIKPLSEAQLIQVAEVFHSDGLQSVLSKTASVSAPKPQPKPKPKPKPAESVSFEFEEESENPAPAEEQPSPTPKPAAKKPVKKAAATQPAPAEDTPDDDLDALLADLDSGS